MLRSKEPHTHVEIQRTSYEPVTCPESCLLHHFQMKTETRNAPVPSDQEWNIP